MRARIPALVLLAVLTLPACTGTSRSSSCVNGVCTVSLSGEQTVEIEIGPFERDLRVAPITPDAVTVTARGESADLSPGESAEVGGLLVRVDTIAGRDVGLQVERS
ncbi:hypothetical protein [Pseudonocardia abyssalis]|uniref:DUF5666 domain-containing protein n=1 Tax=Pseudonocardia abyssalis TaxID=2792008 RepID=A0ABS6UMW0_9PSEU|nr:hypothetical protein [Pseudonocardia abyssalis]MBW0117711.1 hypothetical protein [Pseudonocardia abyssalis]MBW0133585.1 hypothetical protein [Pseudonocardia abyssalis]